MGFSGGKKRLGYWLCWSVVFADIGTSVYYTPGVLYAEVRSLAATFVLLTGIAFVFLAAKYAEIATRFREGGGVVAVASEAFGPYVGALGGMLITVDYFLTAAISSVSGVQYFASLVPVGDWLVPIVIGCLLLLGILNGIGIKESAGVTLVFALCTLAIDLGLIGVVGWQLNADDWRRIGSALLGFEHLQPKQILIGFAGAWLAFSGLESISQIAPAMRSPRQRTARVAMVFVVLTILATSPLLTAFATVLDRVDKRESERFISELAFAYGGLGVKIATVLTASVLLLFAANTAIIGCYHVFRALAKERFLPTFFARISPTFGTPHIAIGVATLVPMIVVAATGGNLLMLGHMYAFGLLGAFTLSAAGLDVIRWRERRLGLGFVIGVLTTLVVASAWLTNMVTKPLATYFGGAVALGGTLLAIGVRRGWFAPISRPLPYISRAVAEDVAADSEASAKILSLTEARDLQSIYRSTWLLCLREMTGDRLTRKTAERVRQSGESALYVLFVDEVPGLFFPAGVEPSGQANEVLQRAVSHFERDGLTAIPLWRVGHSAGETIAHTARELALTHIVVGSSRRTPMWQLLRGSVLREVNAHMVQGTELTIVR